MGTIHRAHDRELDRYVAYKRLRVDREAHRASMTALFRREYETMLSLEHPCTVQAFDYGFEEAGPFYTMELLSGADLSQVAPLPWRAACAVLRDVASALALLHARRLVHRDVSSNNVRVLADGAGKLLDYGALAAFGPPRDVVGTPAFMSPECARGRALDGRADLFSLGALAYWLLTRRPAFPARDLSDLERAWATPLRAPSSLVPELPVELDELLLHLLKLDREARPDAAAHVIERLTTLAQLPPERGVDAIARSFLARPPLAERDDALERIRRSIAGARGGHGEVLLLEASSGLGRSALLEQVNTEAQLEGLQVLRGAGRAHSAPFTLLRELLQDRERARSERLDAAPAGSAAEVAEQRAHAAERLQNELLARSALGPTLISVDDAQLADSDSLRVLSALSGSLADLAVSLILSVDTATPLEPEARAKLERHAERVILQPLSAAGTTQLAASVLADVPNARHAAAELYEASSGSPGTAIDLLRTLLHLGDISYAGGTFTVPQTLSLGRVSRRALRLARLADLDAPTQRVATLLALSTEPLSRRQLQGASALSQRQVTLVLGALTRRGLVSATPGETYTLGSPLLRAELDEQLDTSTRATLHAAIARVILEADPREARAQIAAGAHIIRSGVDELRGAHIVAEACHRARYEVASLSSLVPSLEAALAVYERHQRPDREAARLLVPLALSGFFGDLAAQNRHLPRTLAVLSRSIGIDRVPRLSRWVGPRLALYTSLLLAFFLRARGARSFRDDLQALFGVVASAVAAYVSAFDPRAAMGVAAWLEPFASSRPRSGPALAREFAWSTIDVTCGRLQDAERRLARIEAAIARGAHGIDARVLELIQRGILNGRAQLAVTHDDARVLEYAAALRASSAFFAPHAEAALVGYYGLRGEDEHSDDHRTRAEEAALRGGLSWSATSVLLFWLLQRHSASENAVGLMHVTAALERLQEVSPGLGLLRALALASLSRVRGRDEEAAERYASILDRAEAKLLPYYGTERAYQVECLQRLGRYAEARQLCLDTLRDLPACGPSRDPHRRRLHQQLALLTAHEGNCSAARESLSGLLAAESATSNPLTLGSLHHDLAVVALVAGAREDFLSHANAAQHSYRITGNASLLARHERLLARARRAGLLDEAAPVLDDQDDLGDTHVEGFS